MVWKQREETVLRLHEQDPSMQASLISMHKLKAEQNYLYFWFFFFLFLIACSLISQNFHSFLHAVDKIIVDTDMLEIRSSSRAKLGGLCLLTQCLSSLLWGSAEWPCCHCPLWVLRGKTTAVWNTGRARFPPPCLRRQCGTFCPPVFLNQLSHAARGRCCILCVRPRKVFLF